MSSYIDFLLYGSLSESDSDDSDYSPSQDSSQNSGTPSSSSSQDSQSDDGGHELEKEVSQTELKLYHNYYRYGL